MIRAEQLPTRLSRETVMNITAVVASLLLNGLLLLLVGIWSVLQAEQRLKVPPPRDEEWQVSLEELMPQLLPQPEAVPEPEKQTYIETFADQRTEQAPERAPFESDLNTRAATEKAPSDPADAPVPTQVGLDKVKGLSLRDHNFADGPDQEIPRSDPSKPGMPVVSGPPRPPEASMEKPSPVEPAAQAIPQPVQERPEETSPTEMKAVANADRGQAEEAPPAPKETPIGPAGGVPERMEMAKVDLPAQMRELGDAMDEVAPRSRPEDAMPEKAPELMDPTVSILQAPRVRPSAMLAPKTEVKPEPPSMPVPPGAAPQPLTNGKADTAAFSPARKLNTMKGSLSNIGESAVDAEATEVGAYKKALSRAVERRWHELRLKNGSFVSYGSLKIRFLVNSRGQVSGIRVLHQDAGAILTDFSIAAIATASIPPMPPDVKEAFGNEPLEVSYDILIY